MATSAVPAFKSALVARLQADSGLTGVPVTYGPPQPGEWTEKEFVWVGAVRGDQATATIGTKSRDERWIQDIVVSCVTALRNDQETLTERAYAIAAEVEGSLRAWSQVVGAAFDGLVIHALVVGLDLDENVSTEERESRVTMRVECFMRI